MFLEIQKESKLYQEALNLRYVLFFESTRYDQSVLHDELEPKSRHFAIVESERLIAYGRLSFIEGGIFQISQIVVNPSEQRKGYGSKLLSYLLEECERAGSKEVFLNARVSAVSLYSRLGFKVSGVEYLSPKTKIPHIKMVKRRGI